MREVTHVVSSGAMIASCKSELVNVDFDGRYLVMARLSKVRVEHGILTGSKISTNHDNFMEATSNGRNCELLST